MVLHKAQIYLYFCLYLVPHGGYVHCKIEGFHDNEDSHSLHLPYYKVF